MVTVFLSMAAVAALDYAAASPAAECVAGKFSATGSGFSATDCTECADGWISAASGATQCVECGMGTYSSPSGTACAVCPLGFFHNDSSVGGVSACTACADGRFTEHPDELPQNRRSCVDCPTGARCTAGIQVRRLVLARGWMCVRACVCACVLACCRSRVCALISAGTLAGACVLPENDRLTADWLVGRIARE